MPHLTVTSGRTEGASEKKKLTSRPNASPCAVPTWFERLTGFPEESPSQVRSNLAVEGSRLRSTVNGRAFRHGTLEVPSLADLRVETSEREEASEKGTGGSSLSVRQVVAGAQDLHADPSSEDALFQVASQFNLLEMTGPSVTPEDGVGRYERDQTQGPACAIAAGAGTIYRNYFAKVQGQPGQTADRQINCLEDVGTALGNEREDLWRIQNGYALASEAGLRRVGEKLQQMSAAEISRLRGRLRIGIQRGTEVTLPGAGHEVTQVYTSALPVAYSSAPAEMWAPFGKLVLEAAYEATLRAGIKNGRQNGNWEVYLTLLGGGAFGNPTGWIIGAIRRALSACQDWPLDIAIVSYGRADPNVERLVSGWD